MIMKNISCISDLYEDLRINCYRAVKSTLYMKITSLSIEIQLYKDCGIESLYDSIKPLNFLDKCK